MRTWRLTWRVFLHSRPQCLRVWGRDWFPWCNFFFFFVVCKLIMRAAWMLKRGQNRKRWVFFRLRFSFRAAVTLTLWTREVGQLLCGYFSPMEKEKKKHQKTASYAGFRAPSSHVGSLRLVFIMRAREGQSILWYYQKLRLVWPKML